uniref:Ribosomal L1 domain-containing protein 1 n=1 Tax=Callorhinchus milii TaxID=7868 RepID=V9KT75_CALMI
MESLSAEQITKAVQALLAYVKKSKDDNPLFLNEHQFITLVVTVWKIPEKEKTLKIPLPHGIRTDTTEVCLFTRDEPNMSADQTEKFYKKLLTQQGIKNVTQIIPYKALKTEYKAYEAKRRLLSSYDLFLADDRIRRLLPSHIGKHFYKAKKVPQSIKLTSNKLVKEMNKLIQGTILPITNKGCCYTSRVAHTGMKVQEVVENIIAAARKLAVDLPKKWKNVKILHLKTPTSVSLPIYNSGMHNLVELQKGASKKTVNTNKQKKVTKVQDSEMSAATAPLAEATTVLVEANDAAENTFKISSPVTEKSKHQEDEEIPQLVPIEEQTPAKKAKLQKSKQKTTVDVTPVNMKLPRKAISQTPAVKETPKQKPDHPEMQTPDKRKKKVQTPKQQMKENVFEKSTKKKTPKKSLAKSAGIVRKEKLVKSAMKAPKTPKQKEKKQKVPQSA